MAKKKDDYEVMAETTSIKATSRVSIKVNDTFYTLEYTEERQIPAAYMPDFDIEKERKALWDTVNAEVDKQVEDVYNAK